MKRHAVATVACRKGGNRVRTEMISTMNAMNISLLVICVVIAAGMYWGGFREEKRGEGKSSD